MDTGIRMENGMNVVKLHVTKDRHQKIIVLIVSQDLGQSTKTRNAICCISPSVQIHLFLADIKAVYLTCSRYIIMWVSFRPVFLTRAIVLYSIACSQSTFFGLEFVAACHYCFLAKLCRGGIDVLVYSTRDR
jgi:hypothetical protein